MSGHPGRYGRRLSAAEHDERAFGIHNRAFANDPSASPEELERRVRKLELDLAIDLRIGVDFPRDKREELMNVRERLEEKRSVLTRRLLRREITREAFAEGMQQLVDMLVTELSPALTADEVKKLLSIPTLAAALPLDPGRIRLPNDR